MQHCRTDSVPSLHSILLVKGMLADGAQMEACLAWISPLVVGRCQQRSTQASPFVPEGSQTRGAGPPAGPSTDPELTPQTGELNK